MMKMAMILSSGLLAGVSPAFAGAVDEMLAADRAFAQMATEEGVAAAFAAYAAPDVRMFPDGGQPYSGKDAMIARFANWPACARLEWTPAEGMASEAGDFGFTWGRFVFTTTVEDGSQSAEHGKYVSVWRKTSEGWKFVADIGNSNPAPDAPQ